MQTRTQSLLDYLRIPNPAVSVEACPNGPNTQISKADSLAPRKISEWEDFEYDAMDVFFGGGLRKVLEQEFDMQDFSGIPDFPFCKFFDENSLESLIIKWNQSIVSEALSKAQCSLNQMHDPVYMVRGGQAKSPLPSKKLKPDWGCVRLSHSEPRTKQKNLLPGDTKVSAKWSSKFIKTGNIEKRQTSSDWIRPIVQIYTYCVLNNTRYGYIITDAELVAVRIRLRAQHNSQTSNNSMGLSPEPTTSLKHRAAREGVLEYKAIPWANCRNEGQQNHKSLTVNLALWWLHLMAAGKTDISDDYGPLRDILWKHDVIDQQQDSQEQAEDTQYRAPLAEDEVPDIQSMGLVEVSIGRLQTADGHELIR